LDEVGYTMEDDEDRELEHYVWQHKDEPLRKIRNGMLKEYGRTKSTKWIRPRREEARRAQETTEVEVVLPKDEEIIDEGEKKERAEKEEDRYEEDPEIIETKLKIVRLKKEQKRVQARKELQETKNQLALLKEDAKTIEDLKEQKALISFGTGIQKSEIRQLKEALTRALSTFPNYVSNADCDVCEGGFLLYYSDDPKLLLSPLAKCFLCGKDWKIIEE